MLHPDDYTVGWICALPIEYVAAQEQFDEEHDPPEARAPHDANSYALGAIGQHNVVIAVLPKGEYGIASASTVATNMLRSFPNIRIGLMVGIGGGAPSSKHDIRLGDIVVSIPESGHSGVSQYDFGKTVQNRAFKQTGMLDQPPQALRTAVAGLQAKHERKGNMIEDRIIKVLSDNARLRRKYGRPLSADVLFRSEFEHVGDSCSDACVDNQAMMVPRLPRAEDEDDPQVHYGTIASANSVMKDALIRDRLAAERDVLCFEMEAAGLMNSFPCLVIRGVCDYSDSHKNKVWQGFAALTAASYAKDLICHIPPQMIQQEAKLGYLLSKIHAQTSDVHYILNQEKDQRILNWITDIDFHTQQNEFFDKKHPGTCQWLLESAQYRKWIDGKTKTLLYTGIPGAGKTIAMSVVIDNLKRRFLNDPTIGVAYFYCNFNRAEKQTIKQLVGSLLKQLCYRNSSVMGPIASLHSRCKMQDTWPSLQELSQGLEYAISEYSKVFLIIDALDEWQQLDADRLSVLDQIFNFQKESGMNIMVTSRPNNAIETIIKGHPGSSSLTISASQDDVYRYVDGNLNRLPSFVKRSVDLQIEIKDCICGAVDGMFLLAKLYLGSLESTATVRQLKDLMRQFQQMIDSKKHDPNFDILGKAYDVSMARINAQHSAHQVLAHEILSWVLHAKRELRIQELRYALAAKSSDGGIDVDGLPEAELLVSVCCGLVVVNTMDGVIRLVHYTTHAYLDAAQRQSFPNADAHIAETCMKYLYLDSRDLAGHNSLYSYAIENWGHHARTAGEGPTSPFNQKALEFLSDEKFFSPLKVSQRDPSLGLHGAAHFGLYWLIPALLKRYSVDEQDMVSRTALRWAVEGGHEATVELLARKGADLNRRHLSRTPLHWAVIHNNPTMVKLLCELGANPMSTGGDDVPIKSAVSRGCITMVETLLNAIGNEAKQIAHAEQSSSIYLAAQHGNVDIFRLLQTKGADINAPDHTGRTPLYTAIRHRDKRLVRFLLDENADPCKPSATGAVPITAMIPSSGLDMYAVFFEEHGISVNCHGPNGQTPLMRACQMGHYSSVDYFLRHGADVNLQDQRGNTALLEATWQGNTSILKLLRERGANLGKAEGKGDCPSSGTIKHRYSSIAELTLQLNASFPEYQDG